MMRARRQITAVLVALGLLSGAGLLWSASALAAALEAPAIGSEAALEVTPVSAVLEARVNPDNEATTYHFEYATNESEVLLGHGTTVGEGSLPGVAEELQAGPAAIGGLEEATTYYYRVVAADGTGTTEGTVAHFTTPALEKPKIEAQSTSGLTQESVVLTGLVNPEFQPVLGCEFQFVSEATYIKEGMTFGATPKTAGCVPAALELGEGAAGVSVESGLLELEANQTTYYRLVVTNATGTSEGAAQHFQTPPETPTISPTPPVLGAAEASAIGQSTATINTTLNAQGLPTRWELRAGITQGSLGFQTAGNTTGSTAEALTLSLTSLTPGDIYYYKLIAQNPDGTVETAEGSFTTVPAPPPVSINLFATAPLLSIPTNSFPTEEAGTVGKEVTTKTLSRAQKLKNALKACKKDKAKGKRAGCERAARKKYGPTTKQKKK
jgi:phosphodiesterase/alkaline phosphatase D-like protein